MELLTDADGSVTFLHDPAKDLRYVEIETDITSAAHPAFQVVFEESPVTYADGQQLMARVGDGFSADSSVALIDGAIVCVAAFIADERAVADAADRAGAVITLNTFASFDEVFQNFTDGACDVVATRGSELAYRKSLHQPADQEWVIFPREPITSDTANTVT